MIPVGTNLSLRNKPWVTELIILVNLCVFLFQPRGDPDTDFWIRSYFCTVPGEQYPWQFITSMFMHGDIFHIFGNLLFLWIFGRFVEDKLGWKDYLFLYFLTGIAAGLVEGLMAGIFMRESLFIPSLGASGAISGIMGVYLYRCYYSKIKLLLSFFFPVRVQVPAVIMLGFWFLKDLVGGIDSIRGFYSNVAFWAHVGGFSAGLGACKYLCYEKQARKEKLEFVAETTLGQYGGYGEGIEATEKLLETDPDNPQWHLNLARAKTRWRASQEGKDHYEKGIKLLLEKEPDKAAEVYAEYWQKYLSVLEPRYQVRLSFLLNKQGYTDLSVRSLEVLTGSKQARDVHMEKAFLDLARIYAEGLKREDLARYTYEKYLREFPASGQREFVEKALGSLRKEATP